MLLLLYVNPHDLQSPTGPAPTIATGVPTPLAPRRARGADEHLDYTDSPLLDASPSAGTRLPNLSLRDSGGARRRLYDLLPRGSALLVVREDTHP